MYPTGSDLQAYLISSGCIEANSNESLDYDGFVNAAIEAWEKDSGYFPFLSTESTTRTFNAPQGNTLDIGAVVDIDAITISGVTQTLDTDFSLSPSNAIAKNKPYTQVIFRYPLFSSTPNCISITGAWGYCTELPSDVRLAILSHASMLALTNVSNATGNVTQIKQDDISISYSSANAANAHYSSRQMQFKDVYDSAVKRYRQVRLF